MVYFVGAGPGAEDLITVRGMRLLEKADVIIYAGSLVNPALLKYAKESCEIHNSACMTLEEVLDVIYSAEEQGKMTVRLHTGDGAIYGAIREQMDELQKQGIAYEVCPGVSSFLGAAASLKMEYTLPGVSQSVIITRAEGRTPVPERESLKEYAHHHATLVLFLSSGLAEKVRADLLEGGYEETTPVAVVYKATWPDEKIIHTTLGSLPEKMKEENISKTALIIVGDVLGEEYEKSKLYDASFSTEFRKASKIELSNNIACNLIANNQNEIDIEQKILERNEFEKKVVQDIAGTNSNRIKNYLIIACSKQGYEQAQKLKAKMEWNGDKEKSECDMEDSQSAEIAGKNHCQILVKTESLPELNQPGKLVDLLKDYYYAVDGIIFICATGIAVRTIAPYLQHKSVDPAVVAMDETGKYCVSLVSGHAGGANALANYIAKISGAEAVITTATDREGLFAVDEFARRNHLSIEDWKLAKEISAMILQGKTIDVISDYPIMGKVPEQLRILQGVDYATGEMSDQLGIRITNKIETSSRIGEQKKIDLIPKNIIVGIGCKKNTTKDKLQMALHNHLQEYGISERAICEFVSIDLKAEEEGILAMATECGVPFHTFSAEELNAVEGQFADSDFVKKVTGVDNVCERSCVAAGGILLTTKKSYDGITIALAEKVIKLTW